MSSTLLFKSFTLQSFINQKPAQYFMRMWRSQVAHCSDKAGVRGSNPRSLTHDLTLLKARSAERNKKYTRYRTRFTLGRYP